MFNICLGDQRALEPQGISSFMGVEMSVYKELFLFLLLSLMCPYELSEAHIRILK